MTDAFQATFDTFKHIKGRDVYQIILEVQPENIDHALSVLGGCPSIKNSTWVAVARLKNEPKKITEVGDKRKWHELTLREQACIRCEEVAFQDWISHHDKWGNSWLYNAYYKDTPAEFAKQTILNHCGVASRSHIDSNREAAEVWRQIDADYLWFVTHGE